MRRLFGTCLVAVSLHAVADQVAINPALTVTSLPVQETETGRLSPYEVAPVVQRSGPSISLGSPLGFGMEWGTVALGGGIQQVVDDPRARFYGSNGVAIGIGQARWLALELSAGVNHLYEFGDSGGAGFKLHHSFGYTAVSVGMDQAVRWGLASNGNSSTYVALTRLVPLAEDVLLSVNLGGKQSSDAALTKNLFGGVAILFNSRISFVTDYTGRDLNAGVSFVPVDRFPLSLTVGATNLLEKDNTRCAVVGSAGLALKFQ